MDVNLQRRILDALLGKPLIGNAFRGTLVEAILAEVLEPEWRWCAGDWGSYDFENARGVGLEVKQSSALQSWHTPGLAPNRGRFEIAERTGRYEGPTWIAGSGRAASIYVFAWHPVTDPGEADHRDVRQWDFHVVSASELPAQKSIGLAVVRRLAAPVGIAEVRSTVDALLR